MRHEQNLLQKQFEAATDRPSSPPTAPFSAPHLAKLICSLAFLACLAILANTTLNLIQKTIMPPVRLPGAADVDDLRLPPPQKRAATLVAIYGGTGVPPV